MEMNRRNFLRKGLIGILAFESVEELLIPSYAQSQHVKRNRIVIAEPEDLSIYRPGNPNEDPVMEIKGETVIDNLKLSSDDGIYYYFDDGEQHPNFKHQYVSVDKERRKISLGCPAGLKGIAVEFLPKNPILDIEENQYLYISAKGANYSNGKTKPDFKAKGHLSLFNKDKVKMIPHFISNGSYKIVSGEFYVGWGPHLNNPIDGINEKTRGRKMVNLQVSTFNSDEERVGKSDIFLFNNKYKTAVKENDKRDLSKKLWQSPIN